MLTDYFKVAQDITRKYARDLKDANSLTKKSRIVESHAVSRAILVNQQLASVSMNDIIEAAGAEGLLRDPLVRKRLQQMGSALNSCENRF